jgi:hypothetical protein
MMRCDAMLLLLYCIDPMKLRGIRSGAGRYCSPSSAIRVDSGSPKAHYEFVGLSCRHVAVERVRVCACACTVQYSTVQYSTVQYCVHNANAQATVTVRAAHAVRGARPGPKIHSHSRPAGEVVIGAPMSTPRLSSGRAIAIGSSLLDLCFTSRSLLRRGER